jgi:hypothetical protein
MRLTACVLLVLFLMARSASAQTCLGAPSFREAPYQAGVGASFTEGLRQVEGTFSGGGETLFAGAGASVLNFTDLDQRTAGVSAFAGAELATDQRNRVLLCPIVRLGFLAGPDIGPVDLSSVSIRGGGSIGVIAAQDGDLTVVPFFGLAFGYTRVSTQIGDVEDSASDTGGIADLGVGLILTRTVGITPQVSIPFSSGPSDAVFTIRFTFNFGN